MYYSVNDRRAKTNIFSFRGRHGRDRMIAESRSGRGVQHYVIKFVIDLRQVGGFLRVLRFPLPIKLTATI